MNHFASDIFYSLRLSIKKDISVADNDKHRRHKITKKNLRQKLDFTMKDMDAGNLSKAMYSALPVSLKDKAEM